MFLGWSESQYEFDYEVGLKSKHDHRSRIFWMFECEFDSAFKCDCTYTKKHAPKSIGICDLWTLGPRPKRVGICESMNHKSIRPERVGVRVRAQKAPYLWTLHCMHLLNINCVAIILFYVSILIMFYVACKPPPLEVRSFSSPNLRSSVWFWRIGWPNQWWTSICGKDKSTRSISSYDLSFLLFGNVVRPYKAIVDLRFHRLFDKFSLIWCKILD